MTFFYRRHEIFWKEEALRKLPVMIQNGGMLVCGEDLGMLPDTVKDVMQQLNILSLEVQRMPKNVNDAFVNPLHNPYLSVDTTSTHDMSTLRAGGRRMVLCRINFIMRCCIIVKARLFLQNRRCAVK